MTFRFKYNHWVPKRLGVNAITLYPYILFACPKKEVTQRLYRHELEHADQIREVGVASFYLSYFLYYLAGLVRWWDHEVAYLKIPYEVEAYAQEGSLITSKHMQLVHKDHMADLL